MPRKKVKMLNDYQKAEDVNMRLNESVIFFQQKPVYVLADGMELDVYELRSNFPYIGKFKANSPDFDVRSPPLGFVNGGKYVSWVFRSPQRKQKQGISHDNTFYAYLTYMNDHRAVGQKFMSTVYFEQMLLGIYPTYPEALQVKGDAAFHRHFAIQKNEDDNTPLNLFHLDRVVANFDGELSAWKIKPQEDNTVLRMSLVDLGVPVA